MAAPPIILFNPQSSASRKPVLPMALLALGAVLEGRLDYRIVDGNLREGDALDRIVADAGADVVGVTVMGGPQLRHAVAASRRLKEHVPHLTIVWGGYFPTQHADVCLRSDFVDYVVAGHGEHVFLSLASALRRGEDPRGIPGVVSRDGTDSSFNGAAALRTAGRAEIPDPDGLPDFPYHRVPVERYVRQTFLGRRTLPHHSSYGCPFRCNFCAVVNMVDGRWMAQSAERTAAVVRQLVDTYRADAVEFYDNNFFVHEERTADFAERIEDLDISWWGEARVDTLLRYDERTWRRMQASGLKMVFLGAESGSDETLRRMNKGGKASAEKTLHVAARMREHGIVPEFSFVVGNPPDPDADAGETLTFIRRVKEVHPEAEIILYMYTPVPLAGELYEQAQASGFAFPETLEEWAGPEWQDFAQRRSGGAMWMGDPLRRRVRNFERVLNAYYPTATDQRLQGWRRRLLRVAGGWRYRLEFYDFPLELHVLQKMLRYRRPETTGF